MADTAARSLSTIMMPSPTPLISRLIEYAIDSHATSSELVDLVRRHRGLGGQHLFARIRLVTGEKFFWVKITNLNQIGSPDLKGRIKFDGQLNDLRVRCVFDAAGTGTIMQLS